MRIDAALGIDETEFSWNALAACRDMMPESAETDWFFNAYESKPEVAKAADGLCMSCPVQRICAEYAVTHKEEGLWGGVYWNAQGRVDVTKNAHKTDEVWEQLELQLGMNFRSRRNNA
ncbi:MAG: WhiB family transcriptional regulator [Sphaerochaetaceae bacterium]